MTRWSAVSLNFTAKGCIAYPKCSLRNYKCIVKNENKIKTDKTKLLLRNMKKRKPLHNKSKMCRTLQGKNRVGKKARTPNTYLFPFL